MILLLVMLGCQSPMFLEEPVSFLDYLVFSDQDNSVQIAGLAGFDWMSGDVDANTPLSGFELEYDPDNGLSVMTHYYAMPDKYVESEGGSLFSPIAYSALESGTVVAARLSLRGLRMEAEMPGVSGYHVRLENTDADGEYGDGNLLITFIASDGTILDDVLIY